MKSIPDKDYKKILEYMPICCVDIVVLHNCKVLLVKRNRKPAKDEWFVPGGRVLKNEKLEDAAVRKAKEEVGLNVEVLKKIGVYETTFKSNPFDLKNGVHTINICFLVKPINDNFEVKIDETSSDYKWFEKIEENLHPYVKKVLKDAKIW